MCCGLLRTPCTPFLPPIVGTFMRMLRPAGTLLSLMITVMYFLRRWACRFGGLVNRRRCRENALLNEVAFGSRVPAQLQRHHVGIIVCFELIMVNNWMVIAEGFAVVTNKGRASSLSLSTWWAC